MAPPKANSQAFLTDWADLTDEMTGSAGLPHMLTTQ